MRFAVRAGQGTAWTTRGKGDRAVLLVHCSLASGRAWSEVMDRMGDRFAITAFDLPGHGRSGAWDGAGDYLTRCIEIAATFCEGPVDLVGHSLGGVVALGLAVARPELVRTLTLIEPVLFALARGTAEHDAHRAAFAPVTDALAAGDRMRAARLFAGIWGGGTAWEALPERQRAAMASRIHLVAATAPALDEDSCGIARPGRIARVSAPTLLIEGERAAPVIARVHARLAQALPAVRREIVAGAGHMAPISHPDAVAGLVGAHLSRAGS